MKPGLLFIVVASLQFGLAEAALARDCNAAEKAAADKQLWLNARDRKAALARHLPWDAPHFVGERLLVQRDYVIAYSDSLRVPLWTAHRLDAAGLGKSGRVDCFRRDPRIPAPAASLTSDYDEPIYDQGHLTPNGDMSRTLNAVLNSFVLSNMAPQHCEFNRGLWQIFESLVRIWAEEQGTLYVLTGSVFVPDGAAPLRMRSRNHQERVAVPTHFYKVLVRRLAGGGVATLAIVVANDETSLDGEDALRHLENHVVSLGELELLTGVAPLPRLARDDAEQATALWPHVKAAANSLARACAR